jgi:hypothetical protein
LSAAPAQRADLLAGEGGQKPARLALSAAHRIGPLLMRRWDLDGARAVRPLTQASGNPPEEHRKILCIKMA